MNFITQQVNCCIKHLLTATIISILASMSLVKGSVPLSEFIPFSESDGNARFRFEDDKTNAVSFTSSSFKFLNLTYGVTYISGNGLISFRQAHAAAGPECNTPTDIPMIIPFWSDANENIDPQIARLTYIETTNAGHLAKMNGEVRRSFSQHRTISLSWMFVVTWKNVASHRAKQDSALRSERNTFQLILATNGINSFVVFYYNQIMWSNRGNALAGFDLGRSRQRFKLAGSCQPDIENLVIGSNVNTDTPGKWIFQVDREIAVPSSSSVLSSAVVCEKVKPVLRVEPPVVSIMGNFPLFVHGLCLENNANVSCVYHDKGKPRPTEVDAILLPNHVVICPVPFLYSLGKLVLNVMVSYPNQSPVMHTQNLYVLKEHEFSCLQQIKLRRTEDKLLLLSAQWDPQLFAMTSIRKAFKSNASIADTEEICDKHCQILSETVQIVILEYDGKTWKHLGAITPPVLNNGVHMSPLNTSLLATLLRREGKVFLRTFAIESKYRLKSGQTVHKIFPSNILLGTEDLMDFTIDFNDKMSKTSFLDGVCQNWYNKEPSLNLDTLPCPNILEQARLDWRFVLMKDHQNTKIINKLANAVYMQRVPSPSGAATQCAYDDDGRLLVWQPSCGRTFRRSPYSVTGYWRHHLDDILPYMYCCKWGDQSTSDKCNQYFSKRPINLGTDYASPRPIRAVGDPHFSTFDGLQYTFNGAGEFWMIKYKDDEKPAAISEFKMQVRMQPFPAIGAANASVITAAVMEQIETEYDVKVQVALNNSEKSLSVLVDGELVKVHDNMARASDDDDDALPKNDAPWNFQNEFTFYHVGVIIVIKSKSEVLISFASGFSFNFKSVDGVALNIIGSAGANLQNKSKGLLGNYDELVSNDFTLPNGTLLEMNMTMENIHKAFGMHWVVNESETIFSYPPTKSYTSFRKPASYSPSFLTPKDFKNLYLPDEDFCQDFEECIFDFLATGSREIAIGTKCASALYQELDDINNRVVRQCSQPVPPTNGFFVGTSYVVGSSLQLKCVNTKSRESNHSKINNTIITCSNPTGDEYDAPTWIDSSGVANPNLICDLPENNDAIIKTIVENRREKIHQTNSSASQSSSTSLSLQISSAWIFIIGFCIFAVVSVVVITKYPPCKPVKHFFTNKYYGLNNRNRDDNISLG